MYFKHLPLLASGNDGITAVSEIIASDRLQRHGSMGQGYSSNWVEFFFEEKDRDEMLLIQPDHIVYCSIVGTQLVRLELILSGDAIVEVVLELWMLFEPMDGSILSQDCLD